METIEINFMTGEKLIYTDEDGDCIEDFYADDLKRFIIKETDYNFYTLAIFEQGEEEEQEGEITKPVVYCLIKDIEKPIMFEAGQVFNYKYNSKYYELVIKKTEGDRITYNIINTRRKGDISDNIEADVQIRQSTIGIETEQWFEDFNLMLDIYATSYIEPRR
jgi:hypothetical protein